LMKLLRFLFRFLPVFEVQEVSKSREIYHLFGLVVVF